MAAATGVSRLLVVMWGGQSSRVGVAVPWFVRCVPAHW